MTPNSIPGESMSAETPEKIAREIMRASIAHQLRPMGSEDMIRVTDVIEKRIAMTIQSERDRSAQRIQEAEREVLERAAALVMAEYKSLGYGFLIGLAVEIRALKDQPDQSGKAALKEQG